MKAGDEATCTVAAAADLSLHREILVVLRRIMRAVEMYSHRLNVEHGVTGPQLVALHALAQRGRLSAQDLARAVQVSRPTITGILDRLERHELVTRTRSDTDRRALNIAITDKGQRLLASAPAALHERFASRLAELDGWEQSLVLATLQRVAIMMDGRQRE